MRVLAVDTTTPRGSLAVVGEDGPLAEARLRCEGGHSGWLLPALAALLGGLGLRARELDAFAVTTGPGSFTGLRVGVSSVQGLALACGRPCVGLSTLDVLAFAAPSRGVPVVGLLEAYRGEVYWAAYDGRGTRLRGPQLGTLASVLADLQGLLRGVDGGAEGAVAFVGDAVSAGRASIEAAMPAALFPETDPYLAPALGRRALQRVAAGEAVAASELRPLYVRGADARLPRP